MIFVKSGLFLATILSSVTTARSQIEVEKRAVHGGILAGAPVNDVRVTSDNVVQCGQATISWTGATSPVTLQVGTGGYYVGVDWLATYSDVSDSSYGWTVDQSSGTSLIFQITDAKGQVAYQQNVEVGDSDDASCLDSEPVVTSSSTSAWSAAPSSSTGGDEGSPSSAAWSAAAPASSDPTSATSSSKSKKPKSSSSSASSTVASAAASSATLPSTSAIIIATGVSPSRSASSSAAAAVSSASSTSNSSTDAALAQAQASQTGSASPQTGVIGGSLVVLLVSAFSVVVGAVIA